MKGQYGLKFDLNEYPLSERNGTYGGKAGRKEGIKIDGENWIIKYPQNTIGMRGTVASYTTAPLSEYIGSTIFDISGIDVHKTALGTRNGKLVVACKDFCKTEGALREIRTLKNIYNEEFQIKMQKIVEFINHIPEQRDGIPICSSTRKQFYIQSIKYRFENFLLPIIK